MAGRKSELGPTGRNVKAAVKRFREARRLSYAELSRKLAGLGREIPPLGLRRMESETDDRRVDVDDLVALALALGVSPLALLLPTEAAAVLPNGKKYPAEQIWKWATGQHPLLGTDDVLDFMRDSRPLDWSDMEATVVEHLSGMNPSVRGAVASNLASNKDSHAWHQKLADEASHGND